MSGPFYFAWIDAGDTFNPTVHNREDELIFSFNIEHNEGEFPELSIDIANPHVGLLSIGRKVWCWFSWFNGIEIVPIFTGRLVGIPNNILNDVITLVFIARPVDYLPQKEALATSLRVPPYFDPTWLADDKVNDPDVVLEGYSRLWHIDRVSLDVSTSDIVVGEDGILIPTVLDVFYDGLSIDIGQVPLARLNIDATVSWDQVSSFNYELNPGIFENPSAHKLLSDWPKPGATLTGGWFVVSSSVIDVLNSENAVTHTESYNWETKKEKPNPGDTISVSMSTTFPANMWQTVGYPVISDVNTVSGAVSTASHSASYAWTVQFKLETELTIGYNVSRGRSEILNIQVNCDFQDLVTDTGSDQYDTLSLTGKVSNSVKAYYFTTNAGRISIEYLLCVARARLLARSRAIRITCDTTFNFVLNCSCRKNLQLNDDRLPGNTATGKIIYYSISGDGDSGLFIGKVKFACTIGNDTPTVGAVGTPTYVNDNYVETDYQVYNDRVIVLDAGDISYTELIPYTADDGITFPPAKNSVIAEDKTDATYRLNLRKLDNGPFTATYNLTELTLSIPRQIDLEAAS